MNNSYNFQKIPAFSDFNLYFRDSGVLVGRIFKIFQRFLPLFNPVTSSFFLSFLSRHPIVCTRIMITSMSDKKETNKEEQLNHIIMLGITAARTK